jgi:hypothetical protein
MEMVRDALGKVEAVRVARTGMMLILCVSEEKKECALCLSKILTYESGLL